MRNENSSGEGHTFFLLKKIVEEEIPLGNSNNNFPKKDILEIPFRATVISSISATSYLILMGIFFTRTMSMTQRSFILTPLSMFLNVIRQGYRVAY